MWYIPFTSLHPIYLKTSNFLVVLILGCPQPQETITPNCGMPSKFPFVLYTSDLQIHPALLRVFMEWTFSTASSYPEQNLIPLGQWPLNSTLFARVGGNPGKGILYLSRYKSTNMHWMESDPKTKLIILMQITVVKKCLLPFWLQHTFL